MAIPPLDVSLNLLSSALPVVYITSRILSSDVWLSLLPYREVRALSYACLAASPFLGMHGSKTYPPYGSQVRPNFPFRDVLAAISIFIRAYLMLKACLLQHLISKYEAAAAAIAVATPTSAAHPASAPDIEAFMRARFPTMPAMASASIM